jgi:hypothetical protein
MCRISCECGGKTAPGKHLTRRTDQPGGFPWSVRSRVGGGVLPTWTICVTFCGDKRTCFWMDNRRIVRAMRVKDPWLRQGPEPRATLTAEGGDVYVES